MKKGISANYVTSRISLFLLVMIFIQSVSVAQNSETPPLNKKQISLRLNFYAKSDSERTAVVSAIEFVKNGKPKLASGLTINIYSFKNGSQELFTKIITNEKGVGVTALPRNLEEDAQGTVHLIAKIENDPESADVEIEGTAKKSNISLIAIVEDSTNTVIAKLTGFGENGELIPIADVDLTFYVQRLFGMLPLGDEATVTTDENGISRIIFPKLIKGDKTGKVTLVVKLENDETYGTVEARADARYGEPLNQKPDTSSALWKSQAPLWMSIAFFLAIVAITTTISYLIYQLYRIKKEKSL